jgi:protein transport protein YIF1
MSRLCDRVAKDDTEGYEGFSSKLSKPAQDENAPDLYIPLMAFITYVLLTGYVKGTNNSFTPEVLVQVRAAARTGMPTDRHSPADAGGGLQVTSTCLVTQVLEIVAVRLCLYLLQAPANLLDLLAFTGWVRGGMA